MKNDSLGDRMKEYYENPYRFYLPRRSPMIIRLDMRAGHSFTKGFQRPFDDIFIESIQETAKYLCENIENVKCSYQQSDEISLLLTDYDNIGTQAWFNKNIQKMCSIAASMATLAFNRAFDEKVEQEYMSLEAEAMFPSFPDTDYIKEWNNTYKAHEMALLKGAMFDARCFSIPKEEVCNYFLWRQNDCVRNSIQMVAQANFSHKQLQNKSCDELQEMLWQEKNINWNDFETVKKRGSCCTKTGKHTVIDMKTGEQKDRLVWEIDKDIPIFTQDRNYIERFI